MVAFVVISLIVTAEPEKPFGVIYMFSKIRLTFKLILR